MAPCCRLPDVVVLDEMRCCQSCGEVLERNEGAGGPHQGLGIRDPAQYSKTPLTSSYTFLALEEAEIRLIEIQPGDFNDRLVCQIFHSTAEGSVYEALSYTWADESGNQERRREIVVCSSTILGARTVEATTNCEMALRRLRKRNETRILWVDALCINQDDVAERGHQVRQMQSIFSKATMVHAYIGEMDHDIADLFDFIENPHEKESCSLEPRSAMALLSRRWFSRIWCLQEVAMARRVDLICGARTVPWGLLPVADLQEIMPKTRPFPLIARLQLRGKQSSDRLYALLEAARRSCKASDPRDMIYAILGMMEGLTDQKLEIDYRHRPADIFERLTEFLLEQHGIAVLSQRGMYDQRWRQDPLFEQTLKMASWAIDWTNHEYTSLANLRGLVQHRRSTQRLYKCSIVLSPYGWDHRRTLTIQGRKAGRVLAYTWVEEILKLTNGDVESLDKKISLQALDLSDHQRQQELAEKTLILKDRVFGFPEDCKQHATEVHPYFLQMSQSLPAPQASVDDGILVLCANSQMWLTNLWTDLEEQYLAGRTLFLLDNMFIGIGPPWLKPDDILVNFEGSQDAFFVRARDKYYTLVGECIIIPYVVLAERSEEVGESRYPSLLLEEFDFDLDLVPPEDAVPRWGDSWLAQIHDQQHLDRGSTAWWFRPGTPDWSQHTIEEFTLW